MVFVSSLITNAYANLTNVILRVAPRYAQHAKAVLVNAHFDTVFGTPGAGLRPNLSISMERTWHAACSSCSISCHSCSHDEIGKPGVPKCSFLR